MRRFKRFAFFGVAFVFAPAIACLAEGDAKLEPTESETIFLNRLMLAESGGRQFARNRASSALGPFQFLGTTFLDLVRRNFPTLASGKTDAEILALRTDFEVARNVALIYTRENASALSAKGKEASAPNLRLAFFAGAAGALKVLEAKPDEPVAHILSEAALTANPFLKGMTVSEFLAREAREADGSVLIGALPAQRTAAAPKGILVHCKMGLASCRHWVALAEKRLALEGRLKEKRIELSENRLNPDDKLNERRRELNQRRLTLDARLNQKRLELSQKRLTLDMARLKTPSPK